VELVRLFWYRSYGNRVQEADVRNYGWRVSRHEPQLRVIARAVQAPETVILFGQFPHPEADWVVPTERKMSNLDLFVRTHDNALAGLARTIDLRGHHLTYVPH
jgi:hypothetical protein